MDQVSATGRTTSPYAATTPPVDASSGGLRETLSTALSSGDDLVTGTIDQKELPASERSVIMKPTPLVKALSRHERALEFEAISMDVHQPQLNLLGDGGLFVALLHSRSG